MEYISAWCRVLFYWFKRTFLLAAVCLFLQEEYISACRYMLIYFFKGSTFLLDAAAAVLFLLIQENVSACSCVFISSKGVHFCLQAHLNLFLQGRTFLLAARCLSNYFKRMTLLAATCLFLKKEVHFCLLATCQFIASKENVFHCRHVLIFASNRTFLHAAMCWFDWGLAASKAERLCLQPRLNLSLPEKEEDIFTWFCVLNLTKDSLLGKKIIIVSFLGN